ncbi:MAG: hypothetical protein Rhirs2KO_29950 [Rhizobiaceae bacterium]
MTIRYGILGAGFMGQEHFRIIGCIDGCEGPAGDEPDAAMRASAQTLVPNAKACASLEELLGQKDIDALVIATPNYQHAGQLREISAIRQLPILVEKPLVVRAEDRSVIEDLEKTYSAPIWVGMEYRYMPPLKRFLEEVEEATGGVRHLSIREHRFPFLVKVGNWNRFNKNTGGTLVEKCCHFFDLMRLIARADPVRVQGSGWQAVNHKDEDGEGVPDIWDAAFAIVDFDSGTRAMLDLCMFAEGAHYQEEITAVGPKGRIDCLIPGPSRRWPAHLGDQPVAKIVIWPRDMSRKIEIPMPVDHKLAGAGDHHGSTYFQHIAFRDMLLNGGKPAVTLRDGWLAAEMGMAAQQASETGSAVSIQAP